MTEEIAATPGWFEARLDEILASLSANSGVAAARAAYLDCVARAKTPGAPSDLLGTEDEACHRRLLRALGEDNPGLGDRLEALEAELAEAS